MGDQLGVKEFKRPLLQQSCFLTIVLIVFSCTPLTCNGVTWHNYQTSDLVYPLEDRASSGPDEADCEDQPCPIIWRLVELRWIPCKSCGEHGIKALHHESNLAGWNSSQPYPCSQEISQNGSRIGNLRVVYPRNGSPSWRGVQCLTSVACFTTNQTTGDQNCSSFSIGLALNNASIAGTLPPDIGNISTLTALELTENPKLTGTLPATLGKTNLFILNLHDNAFYGEIPEFGHFEWPLTLDLSGNNFSGSFPLSQISTMVFLRKLNLGRNDFEGEIYDRAFENMTQLIQLDLSNNRFNGTPPTLTMIKNLQILDMSSNRFTGALSNLTSMSSLRNVNLSRNAFTGSPLDHWNCSELGSLQELYLDYNHLNGTADIRSLFSQGLFSTRSTNSSGPLRVLSLMNNNISNVVYDAKNIEDITTVIRLQGNPYCNSPDSDDGTRCFCKLVCVITVAVNNDKRKVVIIAVVTSVSSLLLLMISLAAILHRNRRYKRYLQLQVQQKFEEFEVKPTIFTYNQLRTATRDFHPDMKLGQGAFGAVYKGTLSNENVVAVKQLFAKSNEGIDQFLNEVVLLTGMKHRNLVNLKGCCIREQQRLLVYEYVDNYDIDKVLLAGSNKALMSWPMRLKICLGVARGLHYLHALAHPRIIHRDIKASNILLARNYETKIADFGLTLLFPDEESYILTMHVAGTKGYLAPEYASYGQLSDKVDVFSFGVLCLEVVSGRRNIDGKLPPEEMHLSKWAWELHQQGRLMDLVDPTILFSSQDEEKLEVQRLITIALLCIQSEAEQRPSMERVVAMLQGDSKMEAVVLKPGNEEQYLESRRLFAVGQTRGLATDGRRRIVVHGFIEARCRSF